MWFSHRRLLKRSCSFRLLLGHSPPHQHNLLPSSHLFKTISITTNSCNYFSSTSTSLYTTKGTTFSSSSSPAASASELPTGLLSQAPKINSPEELLNSAQSRCKKIRQKHATKKRQINSTTKRQAFRAFQAEKLSMLVDTLTTGVSRWVDSFPGLSELHPYELALVRLTIDGGEKTYREVIKRVAKINNRLNDLKAQYLKLLANTPGLITLYNPYNPYKPNISVKYHNE